MEISDDVCVLRPFQAEAGCLLGTLASPSEKHKKLF
jgi:hypothetical protein